jgi:hypothetical protein
MEDCHLEFSPDALHAIASRALEKKTGARGLRSIVEQVMTDIMFELPDQPKGSKYVIDEDVVRGGKRLFPVQPEIMQKSGVGRASGLPGKIRIERSVVASLRQSFPLGVERMGPSARDRILLRFGLFFISCFERFAGSLS